MSSIRIRVELNKGRTGISMSKLASITEEVKKFLTLVGKDANIQHDSRDWLALKFMNSSVYYDCLLPEVADQNANDARDILKTIMSKGNAIIPDRIHDKTMLQYARISQCIEDGDVIGFGIYNNEEDEPEHYDLSRMDGMAISEKINKTSCYHGEVQGFVHAFYKEAQKPKMVIRELSSDELVDCFFHPELYDAAVETLTERDGVVFVEGEVTEDLIEGKIASVDATNFRPAPLFDLAFHTSFIGSVPNFTGSKTTEDFLSEDDE